MSDQRLRRIFRKGCCKDTENSPRRIQDFGNSLVVSTARSQRVTLLFTEEIVEIQMSPRESSKGGTRRYDEASFTV